MEGVDTAQGVVLLHDNYVSPSGTRLHLVPVVGDGMSGQFLEPKNHDLTDR